MRAVAGTAFGLFAVAAVLRVAFLATYADRDWPFTVFYAGDSRAFFEFARALLEGGKYDNGVPFHPPGFAIVLAGIHRILGAGPGAGEIPHFEVKTCLALVSSLGVAGLFLLARPYLGTTRAALAGLLAAANFGLIVAGVAPVTEGLASALTMAILLLFTRGFRHRWSAPLQASTTGTSPPPGRIRNRTVAGVAYGALAGALALTRAESLAWTGLLAAVAAVAGAVRLRDRKPATPLPSSVPLLAGASAFVLVLLPWTLTNHRNLEALNHDLGPWLTEPVPTFVPLTLYGPLNLALANNAEADGTFSRDVLPGGEASGVLDFRRPEHLRLVLHGHEVAARWIVEEPGAFLELATRKLGLAFGGALRWGLGKSDWPAGLKGVRRPVDMFVPDRGTMVPILALLVVAGGWIAWSEGGPARRWLEIVAALTLVRAGIVVLFFGYARQGALVLPLWLSLAGITLAAGTRAIGRRLPPAIRRRAPSLAAAALVLFVGLQLRGLDGEKSLEASGTTLPGSTRINPDLEVRLEPLP